MEGKGLSAMSTADKLQAGDVNVQFLIGTLPEGRVLIDFRRFVDHIKLTPDQALELAESIVEASKQAMAGRVILTGGHQSRG